MHGHGADQEYGTAVIVQPVRHYRPKWESWLFARQGRETADATQRHQCARPFGERGLGDWSVAGPGPRMFSAG
jgi:hypothetical protein